jgi:hypothetical protein
VSVFYIQFKRLPRKNKPAYLNKVYNYAKIAIFYAICEELLTKTLSHKGFQPDINSPSIGLASYPTGGRVKISM